MNSIVRSRTFLHARPVRDFLRFFSSSSRLKESQKANVKDYRRRWLKNDKWPVNRFTGRPWAPVVPMEQNVDYWTKEYAYFGAYDFMDILGDDLTLDPNILCKGPSYMRGQKLTELESLVKRREMYGDRMHSESLQQMDKRINYLVRRANRIRLQRTRHPKIDGNKVPIVKERFE